MSMVPHGGGAPNGGSFATRYPVYQIDFSAVASGKRIATTKRRVRWRFGFPNREALADGQTGTACRGEEHDVTVVWSVTSGKRQITMDGKEVHFSANRGGVLDFSWSVRGNHVIKVVCHASPPLTATPGFRQYDMYVDGQSFFTMPKVYELGIKGPGPARGHPRSAYGSPPSDGYRNYDLDRGGYVGSGGGYVGSAAPSTAAQEEADLKRAIAQSLEESRTHLSSRGRLENGGGHAPEPPAPAPSATEDLLDFSGDAPAAPALPAPPAPVAALPAAPTAPGYAPAAPPQDTQSLVSYQGATNQYPGAPPMTSPDAMSYTSAPTTYGAPASSPPNQYAPQPPAQQYAPQPPAPAQQYAPQPPAPAQQFAPQPPAQDQFAPQPPAQPQYAADQFAPQADDPFAPKPPPPPTHNEVASAILGAYQAPAPPPPPQQNGAGPTAGYETPMAGQAFQAGAPQPDVGGTPQLSMTAAFEENDEPKSELESAMSKLVNFDHIDEPAEKEVKLTMKKEEEKRKKNATSALPPTGTGWIGSGATLSQIQEVKPEKPRKDPSEIMAPPPMLFSPGAVNAGALVVHGEGPPPLQRGFGVGQVGQGFGVGAQMNYGGMPPQGMAPQGMPQQQGYYAQPPPQQQQYYSQY